MANDPSHNTDYHPSAQAAEQLIEAWSGVNGNAVDLTTTDLYRLGLVLAMVTSQQGNNDTNSSIPTTFHELLSKLPSSFRVGLFDGLLQGLTQMVVHSDKSREAVQALSAVSSLLRASHLATASPAVTLETLKSLAPHHASLQDAIVAMLADLFACLTTMHNRSKNDGDNHDDLESILLSAIHALQEEEADDALWVRVVQQLDQRPPQNTSSWRETLLQHVDATQRDYWTRLLDASSTLSSTTTEAVRWEHPEIKGSHPKKATTTATTSDPVQDRIDQVCAILPGLGQGYVETALALYGGNVERTVTALLQLDDPVASQQLPAQLLITDRSLPRRKTHTAKAAMLEEQAAKQVAKTALQEAERQQQEEAALVDQALQVNESQTRDARIQAKEQAKTNKKKKKKRLGEYDDDYDDQWDFDTDDGLASGADSGLYDDYQAVQTYNRVYREVEADAQFWQDQRNTNREVKPGATASVNQPMGAAAPSGKYRGPDKVKGGRIPTFGRGAGRGGRGGGRGRGKPQGRGDISNNDNNNEEGTASNGNDTANNTNNKNKGNKAKALAKRRDQQKKAMSKRSG